MGILKVIVWSSLCIALGVAIGSYRFGGHTAVERAERVLKGKVKAPGLDEVKENVEEAIDSAKKKLSVKEEKPSERHSEEDRDAVNKLIARRKP